MEESYISSTVNKGKDLLSLTNRAMHEKWILASKLTVHEVEKGLTAQESEKESLSCSQSKSKMGVTASAGTCRVLLCSLHVITGMRVLLPLICHQKMLSPLLCPRLLVLNWSV